jgi:polyisoprenoid-binding protein YceI
MHLTLIGLPLALVVAGCARQGAPASSANAGSAQASAQPDAVGPLVVGAPRFVIVPAQSKAAYHAHEEFFTGALRIIGMSPGKIEAVGTTQALEGQFELDPERPSAHLGENTFSVRLNTLTSDQAKRDHYLREIRDDGPSFDKYPRATFKASALEGASTVSGAGRRLDLKLAGDLTIRDITKREVFDVNATLAGDTLTGVATTRFLLSDFGIGTIDFYDTLTVADPVVVEVQFTARAQAR